MNFRKENLNERGTDINRFLTLTQEMAQATASAVVYPSQITFFYSLDKKETEEKTVYRYRRMDRSTLTEMEKSNSGLRVTPFGVMHNAPAASIRTQTEMFEQINAGSKMLLALNMNTGRNIRLLGISRIALPSFNARAGIGGSAIRDTGFWKAAYLTDRLLMKNGFTTTTREGELEKNGMTLILRKAYDKDKACQNMYLCVAAHSGSYKLIPMTAFNELYTDVLESIAGFGNAKCAGWTITQAYTAMSMEYPDVEGDYIPGIRVVTSDCGLTSFSVQTTLRHRAGNVYAIMNEKIYRHSSVFTVKKVETDIRKTIIPAMENMLAGMPKVLNKAMACSRKEDDTDGVYCTEAVKLLDQIYEDPEMLHGIGRRKMKPFSDRMNAKFTFGTPTRGDMLTALLCEEFETPESVSGEYNLAKAIGAAAGLILKLRKNKS